MLFAKVLMKDFCVLRGCLTHKLIRGINFGEKNVWNNSRILLRNLADDAQLTVPKPISSDKIFTHYKQKDGIPDGFKLIYRVTKNFSFIAGHCVVMLTTLTIPPISLILGEKHNFQLPIKINNGIFISDWTDMFIAITLTLGTITSIILLVSRFPFRIYHNPKTNKYIAVYPNILLPWRTTNVTFKQGDVSIIPQEQMWYIQFSNYKINGNKVIFVEDNFERPIDLEFMIGRNAWFSEKEDD